jgi:iron complex outermembrane recepter protein
MLSAYARACAALPALFCFAYPASVLAQSSGVTPIPTITVDSLSSRDTASGTLNSAGGGTLTVPTTAQARQEINKIPGAASVVPDTQWKDTQAATIKDIVDYTPGVWAQPKWGDDTRLSIRGSGLSRNFHLRGVQLYMDGIPINTADGYGDFQEIDPTAYRYVEIFRGANALQYGASSLGGAINFVTPSGRDADRFGARFDAGSFNYTRGQVNTAGVYGAFDYFVTASLQHQDGFREHSSGQAMRGNANFGYQFAPNAETRFYINANEVKQRIPGEVTRTSALTSPQTAAVNNLMNDWQRNIDTVRVANKTAFDFGPTKLDVGAYVIDRHLMHPIFQWLDYSYQDYGGYSRLVDERVVFGHANRFVAGFNLINGATDNIQYINSGSYKGALQSSSLDKSQNVSGYAENSFFFIPNVALVTGTQYLYATRERTDRYLVDGDQSGRTRFNLLSPKLGMLWNVDPTWQVFGNISRSAEVPSFGENVSGPGLPYIPFTDIKAQTATTYEVGTRGRRPDVTWDFALYHAQISNELQCLYSAFGNCNVSNVPATFHRGIEAGVGFTVTKGLAISGPNPDRLWLNVAYTLNDFRFDKDPVFNSNTLPGAPRHYLRSELLYKHPSGVFFGPNIEWVPDDYFVDSANTLTTQPYALWGLRGGFDNGGAYSFYVEGRNLGDRNYISSVSIINVATPNSPLFSPGSGRSVYAGIRGRW